MIETYVEEVKQWGRSLKEALKAIEKLELEYTVTQAGDLKEQIARELIGAEISRGICKSRLDEAVRRYKLAIKF